MELVNVLLSTYNGEKYIKEQLVSVINQTYEKVKIYVRDDGSNDGTISLLRKFQKDNKIVLLEGENVGFGRSFMHLLQYAEDGDYWAFCDQDDVWDQYKLEHAVEKLRSMHQKEPNMYVHNFLVTDENLKPTTVYQNNIPDYSFQMAITECLHMGFSAVINSEFRALMLKGNIEKLPSHDWWAELIAMEFGNIYVDDYIGAKHRRLDNSLSKNNLKNRLRWLNRALRGGSEIPDITREFIYIFGDEMREADKKVLSLFVTERYNMVNSLKKSFYRKRWRTSIASELVIRFLMLIGKI